jgi:glycosyltransferase involved in cell wall biosynthesis
MKICLCTTRLKSNLTEAISKNFFNLSEELLKKGYGVTVLSPVNIEVPTNSNLIIYSKEHSYESKFRVLKNIKKLGKIINKEQSNFDVVHFHVGFLVEAFLLSRLIKKNKTPLVMTIWQPYLSSKELRKIWYFIFLRPKDYLYHFLMNSFLIVPFLKSKIRRGYDKIIVSSDYQKTQLQKLLPENKIAVIPNGLEDSAIKKEDNDNPQPKLLYVGHFTSFKGIEPLIKSLYHVTKTYPGTQLTLAYSGYGSKKKVSKLIKKLGLGNNVVQKNKINVYNELSKNDFLIIPYRSSIGTSHYHNVLLEAMSVGTPILASKVGSIPEIIKDEETGIFINPKKPKHIANKIIDTFENKELRKTISEKQRKLFQEKFLLKDIIQKHLELYTNEN